MAPTLILEFYGVPGNGVFLASAYAAVGTARACIAMDIVVRATPEGIRVEFPDEFPGSVDPAIAAALTTPEALDAAARDWLESLDDVPDEMSIEAEILGTVAALNACRWMTGTAHDKNRLAAITARTIRDANAAFHECRGTA